MAAPVQASFGKADTAIQTGSRDVRLCFDVSNSPRLPLMSSPTLVLDGDQLEGAATVSNLNNAA